MPSQETLANFVAMVESNQHDLAIADFYTEEASIQENQTEPRKGRDNLVAREKAVLARAKTVESHKIGPILVAGDNVVIRWRFRFTWQDNTITEMEEIAYQRREGSKLRKNNSSMTPPRGSQNSQPSVS